MREGDEIKAANNSHANWAVIKKNLKAVWWGFWADRVWPGIH